MAKTTGQRCKAVAMRGSEVCRMHGGAKGSGRPPKSGLYAFDTGKVSETISEAFQRYLQDPDITLLNEEIALVRAYLENYVATFTPSSSQHPPPLTSEFYDTLLGFASRLSRLAKTQAEIEWGPQHLITATQAMVFFNAVMDAVFRHVRDVDTREAIVADLQRTTGLAGVRQGSRLSLPASGPAQQGREKEDSGEISVEASG